jgi:hypothetical protein
VTAPVRASHFGTVRFGNIEVGAVVLTDGTRGYVRNQVAKALGLHEKNAGNRFRQFLADFAPKSLSQLEKFGSPILLPNGRRALFFPAGGITRVASGVINAALNGRLHNARQGTVPFCEAILAALAETGEVALIDEATGFQHNREHDALQKLLDKLLREKSATWERRFHPDYYSAIFRLFGWKYAGHRRNPGHVVGAITLRWVYGVVMPAELMEEVRARKAFSEKHHQWLSDRGLKNLETQVHAVTAIARSSNSYRDFNARCEAAFGGGALQLGLLSDIEDDA